MVRNVEKRRLSLNAALWIAAVPVALAAVRVFMFSRGDTTILRVLLETLQIVPVLMATTLLILPWAFFILGAILLMNGSARSALWQLRVRFPPLILVLYVLGIVVIYTSPIYWAILNAIVYALLLTVVLLGRVDRAWAKRVVRFANILDNSDLPGNIVGIAIIPLLISTLTTWDSFWLPRENLTVSAQVNDGYVLAEDAEWTTILTSERAVLRVRSDTITKRVVCDQGTVTTFHNLTVTKADDLPECAETAP